MTEATVNTERRGGAVWISLNRPDAMNSLDMEMVEALARSVSDASEDPTVRAIVVTGKGRAFCAGVDLKAARERSKDADPNEASARFLALVRSAMNALEKAPVPVIAAVNGATVAGGLELLLCCDLIIAARSALIGDGHANHGLLPGAGGSVRLTRKIGAARTKQLMFTGDLLTPEVLLDWGLVNQVVDDADLIVAAEKLVETLEVKSPLGIARMKRLVDDSFDQSLEAALRNEIALFELHAHSHDRAEGLAAFAEKRPPKFTGR